jgi:hypothetical protein
VRLALGGRRLVLASGSEPVGKCELAAASSAPAATARLVQRCHQGDYLGEHAFQPLALQVGRVLVELVRQRRQQPALALRTVISWTR